MLKIPKREYTAEFKELAVKRVRGGQGVVAVNIRVSKKDSPFGQANIPDCFRRSRVSGNRLRSLGSRFAVKGRSVVSSGGR